jgi:hypothetical protein
MDVQQLIEELQKHPPEMRVAEAAGALARQQAEIADALHAMRAYARENPRHEYQGATQDPNGVHAWLARNERPNSGMSLDGSGHDPERI